MRMSWSECSNYMSELKNLCKFLWIHDPCLKLLCDRAARHWNFWTRSWGRHRGASCLANYCCSVVLSNLLKFLGNHGSCCKCIEHFDLIVSLSATLNCRHCFAVVELILVRFLSGGFEACTQRLRRCANVILCKSFISPQRKFILTHQTHDLCNQRMSWLVLRSLREKTCTNTCIYYN
jgi:hypothetical protein